MKKYKNMGKRGLALLIVLVMCLGMMQLTAFAETDEGGQEIVTEPTVTDSVPGVGSIGDVVDAAVKDVIEHANKVGGDENAETDGEVVTPGGEEDEAPPTIEGSVDKAFTDADVEGAAKGQIEEAIDTEATAKGGKLGGNLGTLDQAAGGLESAIDGIIGEGEVDENGETVNEGKATEAKDWVGEVDEEGNIIGGSFYEEDGDLDKVKEAQTTFENAVEEAVENATKAPEESDEPPKTLDELLEEAKDLTEGLAKNEDGTLKEDSTLEKVTSGAVDAKDKAETAQGLADDLKGALKGLKEGDELPADQLKELNDQLGELKDAVDEAGTALVDAEADYKAAVDAVDDLLKQLDEINTAIEGAANDFNTAKAALQQQLEDAKTALDGAMDALEAAQNAYNVASEAKAAAEGVIGTFAEDGELKDGVPGESDLQGMIKDLRDAVVNEAEQKMAADNAKSELEGAKKDLEDANARVGEFKDVPRYEDDKETLDEDTIKELLEYEPAADLGAAEQAKEQLQGALQGAGISGPDFDNVMSKLLEMSRDDFYNGKGEIKNGAINSLISNLFLGNDSRGDTLQEGLEGILDTFFKSAGQNGSSSLNAAISGNDEAAALRETLAKVLGKDYTEGMSTDDIWAALEEAWSNAKAAVTNATTDVEEKQTAWNTADGLYQAAKEVRGDAADDLNDYIEMAKDIAGLLEAAAALKAAAGKDGSGVDENASLWDDGVLSAALDYVQGKIDAYDDADDRLQDAQTAYEQAQAAYDAALAALNALTLESEEKLNQARNDLQAALDAAENDLAQAKQDLEDAQDAYVTASEALEDATKLLGSIIPQYDEPTGGGGGGGGTGGEQPGDDDTNTGDDDTNTGDDDANTPGGGDDANTPGGDVPGGEQPGGDEPGGDQPGADEPGGNVPGSDSDDSYDDTPSNPGTPSNPNTPNTPSNPNTPSTPNTPSNPNNPGTNPGANNQTPDVPAVNAPEADVPAVNAPETDVPAVNAPEADVPAVNAPEAGAPAVNAPVADIPGADEGLMDIPDANVPLAGAPGEAAPETDVPGEDEILIDIADGDVPLAGVTNEEVPASGNYTLLWIGLGVVLCAGAATTGLVLKNKKRED